MNNSFYENSLRGNDILPYKYAKNSLSFVIRETKETPIC